MSVYSEIVRLTGLRDRIANKLVSLGLLSRSAANNKLVDCTEAVEDIDEVTPYLISTSGIKNVANYKYAQIDESAWVPAGTTPSGLESHLTGLGAIGIISGRPRNPISIGTVYPNTGSQGMYANALEIDGNVIKAENIKSGVQILGVTGSYTGESTIDYIDTVGLPTGTNFEFLTIANLPINDVFKIRYISITLGYASGILINGTILSMYNYGSIGYPTTTFQGIKVTNSTSQLTNLGFINNFGISLSQGQSGYTLTISAPNGMVFAESDYASAEYAVHITYSTV